MGILLFLADAKETCCSSIFSCQSQPIKGNHHGAFQRCQWPHQCLSERNIIRAFYVTIGWLFFQSQHKSILTLKIRRADGGSKKNERGSQENDRFLSGPLDLIQWDLVKWLSKVFFLNYCEVIAHLEKRCKNSTNVLYKIPQVLTFYYICFNLSPCMCIYTWTYHIIVFLNPLRVSCPYDTLLLLNISVCNSWKLLVFHNYNIMIKIRKLKLIQYYLISDFIQILPTLTDVLRINRQLFFFWSGN